MRTLLAALSGIFLVACSGPVEKSTPKAAEPTVKPPVVTQFYSDPSVVRGVAPANLCYGVEGATEVTLDPPVERLWPAMTRCFEVKPTQTTTYTITARNAAGTEVKQKTMVQVGPPSVRIVEVSLDSLEAAKGQSVPFCVRAINAVRWELSAGRWSKPPDARGGCAVDTPQGTTNYVVTAYGAMGEVDTARFTVTVR